MNRLKNYIAWFYIMAMFWVIPVYNRGTFESLSQRKIEAFFMIAAVTLIFYIVVSVMEDLKNKDQTLKKMTAFSFTDKAVLVFLLSAAVSFLLSSYKKEAAYGIPGFGMGLLAITVMCLSYFLISRYLRADERIFHLIVASSVIPAGLACINRLGYDPLRLYGAGEDPMSNLYVSTIGNYSWYSHYMIMIIPAAMYMMFVSEKIMTRILYGICLMIGIGSLVVAGTSLSLVICGAVFVIVLGWSRIRTAILEKKSPQFISSIKKAAAILFAAAVVLYVIFFFICGSRDSFANGRGYIWGLSADLYKQLPIVSMIFGVGPNCYMCAIDEYIANTPEAVKRFMEYTQGLALTSAHSEIFDYLVNMGVFGCLSYLGLICLAVRNFVENGIGNRTREAAFLCMISYLLFVTVNFSIVCATPYFFIYMGIACGKKYLKNLLT